MRSCRPSTRSGSRRARKSAASKSTSESPAPPSGSRNRWSSGSTKRSCRRCPSPKTARNSSRRQSAICCTDSRGHGRCGQHRMQAALRLDRPQDQRRPRAGRAAAVSRQPNGSRGPFGAGPRRDPGRRPRRAGAHESNPHLGRRQARQAGRICRPGLGAVGQRRGPMRRRRPVDPLSQQAKEHRQGGRRGLRRGRRAARYHGRRAGRSRRALAGLRDRQAAAYRAERQADRSPHRAGLQTRIPRPGQGQDGRLAAGGDPGRKSRTSTRTWPPRFARCSKGQLVPHREPDGAAVPLAVGPLAGTVPRSTPCSFPSPRGWYGAATTAAAAAGHIPGLGGPHAHQCGRRSGRAAAATQTRTIGIVHPLELSAEDRQAWAVHLADYNVQSPFCSSSGRSSTRRRKRKRSRCRRSTRTPI